MIPQFFRSEVWVCSMDFQLCVSQDWNQGACWSGSPSVGSGGESAFSFIQVIGRIWLHVFIRLRSLFPGWLLSVEGHLQLLEAACIFLFVILFIVKTRNGRQVVILPVSFTSQEWWVQNPCRRSKGVGLRKDGWEGHQSYGGVLL